LSVLGDAWARGQRGWPERYPIAQLPNAPLIVALGGWVVAELADGSAGRYGRAVFYAGLAAWGWEELSDGANLVRRTVGAAGLVYVVVKVAEALGA
jgi:hypothetical protein